MMRHAQHPSAARRLLVLGGLVALSVWGCDGDNLFGPQPVPGPGVELAISGAVGGEVFGGDTLQIRVTAEHEPGLRSVEVRLSGADSVVFRDSLLVNQDPASVDRTFTYHVPTGINDLLRIRAVVRDSLGVAGQTDLVTLQIKEQRGVNTALLQTWIDVDPQGAAGDPHRIELDDSVRITVAARDRAGGPGIRRVGYTVRMVRRSNPADTLWLTEVVESPAGVTGATVTEMFRMTPLSDFRHADGTPFFDPVIRPDTLDLDFFGWGQDAGEPPLCAAAATDESAQQVPCQVITVDGNPLIVAAGQSGHRITLTLVSGRTVQLPEGGSIADAVVHDGNGWLILSNMGLGRLEVFDLDARSFLGHVSVGSQPWGLTFDRNSQNTLYVANSGGTNISQVDLASGPLGQEIDRIRTPNVLLWDVTLESGSFNRTAHGFSDRPQFIAQDSQGWFVFSTRPTGSAPDGTIRLGEYNPTVLGPDMAVRLVTNHSLLGDVEPDATQFAIAQTDFVRTENIDGIAVETHVPGDMADIRSSSVFFNPIEAVQDLRNQLPSSVHTLFLPEVSRGTWNIGSVGLSDTTFIAHSRDRRAVVIGEGATEPTGRVFYWDAQTKRFTRVTTVADLTQNADERVMGVALNGDGQLGVGRGLNAAYFFDPELRLEGEVLIGDGGGGVALHPLHSGRPLQATPHVSFAFVPIGDGVIEIHGTRHFQLTGRAYVRDTLVGPLRATLPFPGDNSGYSCVVDGAGAVDVFHQGTDDGCIAVKLSSPTAAGGVAVVNVTKQDILRETP